MDTPQPPTDDPSPPNRRAWLRAVLRGGATGVLLAIVGETGRVLFTDNFHTIEPGAFYRCSQPSPKHLAALVRAHGIRTVVNLRGSAPGFDWYLNECRQSATLDICQEDICFSAGRLPAAGELRRLIEVISRSERPLLFHCQHGADRTGLASAVALLLCTDRPYDEARRQLGLRYGHVALGRPSNLDRFFDLYEEWLRGRGLTHSHETFRRWVEHDYCPGEYRAHLEPLDMPRAVRAGEPFGATVRFHNTSVKTWHFRPEMTAGVHAWFIVSDARADVVAQGLAGLFDAEVAPGASIDVTVPVAALHRAGRYTLFVDMILEGNQFVQAGSEPLEWEFEVRE
jgi:rhodanese/phosphatase family protein